MSEIQQLICPAAWTADELEAQRDQWEYVFTDQDHREMENALRVLKKQNVLNYTFDSADFPLSVLAEKLREIKYSLENRSGVFLLRNFPVGHYDDADIRLMYAGLAAHIGQLTCQSRDGEKVHDVGDQGKKLTEKSGRGTITSDPLPFHTDRCDVVTLLCLQQSQSGGQSRVASALAVHNAMQVECPDLLRELYAPFDHARAAWEAEFGEAYYSLPVFTVTEGLPACRYLRHFIKMAQGMEGVADLTPIQIQALDTFEQMTSSSKYCVDMDFLPGDIQLLNNFTCLHSRAGYEDDPKRKRHLLRLWLSVSNSRPLDPAFLPLYRAVGAGMFRGGLPEPSRAE